MGAVHPTLARRARILVALILLAAGLAPVNGARAADPDDVVVNLVQQASGLTSPIAIAAPNDGSRRIFVVEQAGRIRVWKASTGVRSKAFLNISGRVNSAGYEQGLLGLAFHPNYENNGRFFVAYTDGQGDLRISRFRIADPSRNNAPESSERILLQVRHRANTNHNGGQLQFRGDLLYISTGDGGGGNDPGNNAQDISSLLGKILRINPNKSCGSKRYCIPKGNPFRGSTPGRGEIWHYGLRNPWRFSFDRSNGVMFIGDVGQQAREEIDRAGKRAKGLNFGWDCREGDIAGPGWGQDYCTGKSFRGPIWNYSRSGGRCAVIGGYVYRGSDYGALRGLYLYADHCSGEVWALRRRSNGTWDNGKVDTHSGNITSFGERPNGEIYVTTLDGRLWKVTGRRR